MTNQRGIHVCPVPATMTENVQFLAQASTVHVPLAGKGNDVKVGKITCLVLEKKKNAFNFSNSRMP